MPEKAAKEKGKHLYARYGKLVALSLQIAKSSGFQTAVYNLLLDHVVSLMNGKK